MALEQLKRELEQFGEYNDSQQQARGSKMLNITRDTGELLAVLVQARGADAVLEIGTSNGYSTLWLAEAVRRLDGRVTTIELPTEGYQLVFLDSDRQHYRTWWPQIRRLLAPRGLLVVDNAISHRDEMAEWMSEVQRDPAFQSTLVPVGKGEWLVVRL